MSTLGQELEKAIAAHGMWKVRLNTGIKTGKLEIPPDQASHDDRCEFGKWLRSPELPAEVRTSPHYKEVMELHAKFHQEAGRVSKLIAGRHVNDAQAAMGLDGSFMLVSGNLVKTLMNWRKTGA